MMHELFGIFGSNFWILIFALPGMSKKEALEVVAKIVVKATIEKGKGKKKKKNTFVVWVYCWWWSYCVELLCGVTVSTAVGGVGFGGTNVDTGLRCYCCN